MKTRTLALALCAVLAAAPVEVAAQTVTTIGPGTASCGTWIAARHDRQALGYEQWIMGFLTGIGFMVLIEGDGNYDQPNYDPLNGMDTDGVWAWVDKYCEDHPPNEQIGTAVGAFLSTRPPPLQHR